MGKQSRIGSMVIAARGGTGFVTPWQAALVNSGLRLRSITRALQRAGRWPLGEVRPQPRRVTRANRRAEHAFAVVELTRRRRGPRSLKGRLLADVRDLSAAGGEE